MKTSFRGNIGGFTLIELLVVETDIFQILISQKR
ncbi:MAG: prepilin-type N-terminal cleavage/methylation domain-containing protein [Elusimicrobiaceae bacterium]|nr:prepilin-type N-terminal cleavage/methylation domain-containing protein [Elusimicrobiaceae bacterium]